MSKAKNCLHMNDRPLPVYSYNTIHSAEFSVNLQQRHKKQGLIFRYNCFTFKLDQQQFFK